MISWQPMHFEQDSLLFDGYRLRNDVEVVYTPDNGEPVSFTIPKGYVTNGADIPRIVWSLFPPFNPKYIEAVVIHDWLCDKASKNNNNKDDFKFADDVFFEALTVKAPKVAGIFYKAVRLHHKLRY